MNGAELAAVQRIIRHQDPRITTEFYGHLAADYLKREVERLSFGPPARQRPRHRPRRTPRRRHTRPRNRETSSRRAVPRRRRCPSHARALARPRLHLLPGYYATLINGRGEGIERPLYASLVTGIDLQNVSIAGEGVIDGNGDPWWQRAEPTRKIPMAANLKREDPNPPEAPLKYPRPRSINLIRCSGVVVQGLTFRNYAGPAVHLVYREDVVVDGMVALENGYGFGCDSLLIDSSCRVRIFHLPLIVGVGLHRPQGRLQRDGRRVARPTEDVLIDNCEMFRANGCGLAVGSETAGSIRNVIISNCIVRRCKMGVYIRNPRGRGGVVERIHVSNLAVDEAREMGVKLSSFFDSVRFEDFKNNPTRHNLELARSRGFPVDVGTPTICGVLVGSMTVARTPAVAVIDGLPERFISDVQLRGIEALDAKQGIYLSRAEDVRVLDFSVGPVESPAVDARNVHRLEVRGMHRCHRAPEVPLVWLEEVEGAFIHDCYVAGDLAPRAGCTRPTRRASPWSETSAPAAPPSGRSGNGAFALGFASHNAPGKAGGSRAPSFAAIPDKQAVMLVRRR
jgi:hypothetical protein